MLANNRRLGIKSSISLTLGVRMHKNVAQDVARIPFNNTERLNFTSNDSIVCHVNTHLSGRCRTIAQYVDNIGLSSGSERVALSGFYADYPVTVHSSFKVSRITGLNKYPKRKSTIRKSDMQSMTPPIFTRMVE